MARLKKPLIWLTVLFAFWAVLSSPTESAALVQSFGGVLSSALDALFGIFDSVLQFIQAVVS